MATAAPAIQEKLSRRPGMIGVSGFGVILLVGVVYSAFHLLSDLSGVHSGSITPYVLLGVALMVALGFEFVNGFHDTANAVATVIYTHSLEPHVAVVWSGFWNFLGVMTSSGLVAFGIISLLPVELILQVGSKSGFGMVFALLVAAINVESRHLVFRSSRIQLPYHDRLDHRRRHRQPTHVCQNGHQRRGLGPGHQRRQVAVPLAGGRFSCAYLLFQLMKVVIKNRKLYEAPKGTEPPPFWIRALLVLTCTGVSFAHGSNDGQKGMGLIMLILVGTVPTAYALNHAVTRRQSDDFIAVSQQAANTLSNYVSPNAVVADDREEVTTYVRTKEFTPNTMLALRQLVNDIGNETAAFGELPKSPTTASVTSATTCTWSAKLCG